ncbi:hypothetical protein ACFX2A_025263 [Malus domestica]
MSDHLPSPLGPTQRLEPPISTLPIYSRPGGFRSANPLDSHLLPRPFYEARLHLQLYLRLAVVDLCFQDLFRVSLHAGMVLGIGDIVAHRAVDTLMGPPRITIRNKAVAATATPAVPARPVAALILETMDRWLRCLQ